MRSNGETEQLKLPKKLRIVLKHSLAAGEEIHAVLPDTLDELGEKLARTSPMAKARIDRALGWADSRDRG